MFFDKDISERGKLTKNRLLKNVFIIFVEKKELNNSHEMTAYWQVQRLKLET